MDIRLKIAATCLALATVLLVFVALTSCQNAKDFRLSRLCTELPAVTGGDEGCVCIDTEIDGICWASSTYMCCSCLDVSGCIQDPAIVPTPTTMSCTRRWSYGLTVGVRGDCAETTCVDYCRLVPKGDT